MTAPRARRVRGALIGVVAAVTVVTVVTVVGPARPAAADPARPGNVRSVVTSIAPPAPLTARVVGGDSFLQVAVQPGHELVVADYDGVAYLRFAPDGTVFENRNSKATYQNRSRSGTTAFPADLDPQAPPDWRRVAGGGTYAWHDHRVHWMSPIRAPEQEWTVAVQVDGQPVVLAGHFGPVDAPAAWPWWLAVLASAGLAGLAGRRGARMGAVAALIAAGVAAPVVIGLTRLPGATWTLAALVLAAAAAAVAAAVRTGPVGVASVGAAGVALGHWGLRRADVFGHAVLVTSLPAWMDRAAVAAAIGTGVGLLGGVAWILTRPVPTGPTDQSQAVGP